MLYTAQNTLSIAPVLPEFLSTFASQRSRLYRLTFYALHSNHPSALTPEHHSHHLVNPALHRRQLTGIHGPQIIQAPFTPDPEAYHPASLECEADYSHP